MALVGKIIYVKRVDQTVDVTVSYLSDGIEIAKRTFNFHTDSAETKQDFKKKIKDEVKKVGDQYKDILSKSDNFSDLQDLEITI